jgi:hypothetical protein
METKAESKARVVSLKMIAVIDVHIDGDTLFFFNYRSDRMREIVSVFGLPEKPVEVDIPKDIVSGLSLFSGQIINLCYAYRASQAWRSITRRSHSRSRFRRRSRPTFLPNGSPNRALNKLT